ncbi:glycosyltransferase [Dysgonomonas sp. 521]|uniref:glycosyltransferase family 2 protein n=1 Tax=Dysgonomonas sp. 521 TaxID=2302932 RepID=UPI0013D5D4A7|nr:glycosyltransferase [Dysgonomonas sp. 521]NDV93714.1 glycosyltransferase [Dysgonomonas sp. 521]
MPKVSILMPVYNAGQYLSQALDSIISQRFRDWELILINDGSTDDSESIIRQHEDERIYYIKNPVNLKLIKTLNKGIDYCGGQYIARMDADDICYADRLGHQVAFMDSHPECLMCGTSATVIDGNGKKTGKIHNLADNDYLQINLMFSPPFIHPSVMIRREVLQQNRYDEAYKHAEDYELWCRIAKQGKIANIGSELLQYRWHESNVSVIHNDAQEELKNKIIKDELSRLDITPTEDELYYHRITFQLYNLGNKQDMSVDLFKEVSAWFAKLVKQNSIKQVYNQPALIAFLWARWIVLCISQKKYTKIMSPAFAKYSPDILTRLVKLILFLRKKQ